MLTYRLNSSTSPETAPDFALINAGGIRATIDAGPITRGEVITAFPFGNAIVEVAVSGKRLWAAFEGIIARVNVDNGKPVTSFVQVSRGVRIEYSTAAGNSSSSSTNKLVAVTVGGKPLDGAAEYKIVTLDFVAGGGDNFFSQAFENLVLLDTLDVVVVNHIGSESPVDIALDGRIKVVAPVSPCKSRRAAMMAKRGKRA
jgi:5'-nucleotidase